MSSEHVFESYIRTTADQLWRALTDGTVTAQYYYGLPVESTWQVGAPYRYATPAGSMVEGEVLAVEPPLRLEASFRAAFQPGMAAMRPSRVSWAITPLGTACKLTLTHRDLDSDSPHAQAILEGWPLILSGLKTLLETGEPLALNA